MRENNGLGFIGVHEKTINICSLQSIFPCCTLLMGNNDPFSRAAVSLPPQQGAVVPHCFIYTWSEQPPGLSGASVC